MSRLPNTRYSLLARLGQSADEPDQAAWEEFLDMYEEAVLRYCRSRGLQEADARDVVQDVLLAVHRAADHWHPSGRPGSFRAWLAQTAHRTCLKTLGTGRRRDCAVGGSSVRQRLEEVPATDEDPAAADREWQRWAFCWAAGEVEREVQPATPNSGWPVPTGSSDSVPTYIAE